MNSRLSYSIMAILGTHAAASYATTPADQTDTTPGGLQEITVTAQRRSQNLQDVPIAIQALTAETLTQLNVTTFEDFVKYLPNVTTASTGPGQDVIVMRGLGTTAGAVQSFGAVGSFPNVAIYLDDQSGQLPGRNLDIYAVDLERIEVLEGPQGTLFGSGAEAGAVRYITNKPKLDVTEATANAGYAQTSGGAPSTNADLTINLPLIPDTLAVRAVIYDDKRGGYINNIPGTLSRSPTDKGIVSYFGGVVPPGSPSISNTGDVQNAFNSVDYQGYRAGVLYKFNDDWNALLVRSQQSMTANGVFYETPENSSLQPLPDLSVQLFNPSVDTDQFENTSLTIDGHIDQLKLVYAGGYLTRNVHQTEDYTNYARGFYSAYYQCYGGGTAAAAGVKPQCFSPSATWREVEKNTHQSHELRLSTPDDRRVRAIGGLFWEKYTIQEQVDWFYGNPQAGFNPIAPPPGATSIDPNPRSPGDVFFDDLERGYTQRAAFGSVDFDLIPKVLTVTAGTRYYHFDNYEIGSAVGSFGCRPGGVYSAPNPPDPCSVGAYNLNAENLHSTYSGFKSRANVSWKITSDDLLYYTWSQGFRPGGFNRRAHCDPNNILPGHCTPLAYAPDTLVNNELGWKTEWFNHHLQFNGAVYQEDWKNTQQLIFDPSPAVGFGNLTFLSNGANYRVRGVEPQLVWLIVPGLTVTGSAAWNSGTEVSNPLPSITYHNPYGDIGSPLAQSPPFEGNLRARYEFAFMDYNAFVQIGGTHQAHSYSATDRISVDLQGNSIAYNQPGFSTMDASMGIARHDWTAQLYGSNLTNTRADLYTNYDQFIRANTINVPLTIGLKVSYKFREK